MNKLAIITGTSRGLGFAILNKLISVKGFDILSISRSAPQIEFNKNIRHLNLDFSKFPQTEFFDELGLIISHYEEVIYINNAFTIAPIQKIGTMKSIDVQNALSVNVITPTLVINRILQFCKDKKLTIINITSGAAKRPVESWSIYSASKAYMEMLIRSIQNDYLNFTQLKVINYEPGVIDTGMQEQIRNSTSEIAATFKDLKIQNKLKSADDVAIEVLHHMNQ